MLRHSSARLAAVAIFLLAALPAVAEDRLALIIGNGGYAVGRLDNPPNDAALMAKTLAEAGFEVSHYENLGYRDFQRAVVGFGRSLRAAGDDTVGLVFYAGHAVQANGENYLIPVDAEIQDELDLSIQTLQISTVMQSLESAGNRLNMVILDACRNNPFKSLSRSSTRGLAKTDAPYGTLLAYSTAPGDVAADGSGRNSPYTTALVKAIRTPGMPVEQLFKRVRIEVMERTGNRQIPWESSSLTGDFYFLEDEATPPPAAEAPPTAPATDATAEIEFWKSIAAGTDPALFETYLRTYPDGLFASLAEQRIDTLRRQAEARDKQQADQARQAEAQAAWEQVKDSSDAAMLQAVAERYGDTVYGELARVRAQSLGSAQRAPNSDQAELLFWDSIKESPNKSDYAAYLSRYPDGTFAAIARQRAENGYSPQVAALPRASSGHPYDGEWTLHWEVTNKFYGITWCRNGEEGTKTITLENGRYKGSMSSNRGSQGSIQVEINKEGRASVQTFVNGWSSPRNFVRFGIGDDGSGTALMVPSTGNCHATFRLTRVR